MRADITEGLPGAPLRLALQVVDADCRPLDGARVDVWHCDAAGNYSGYRAAGQRPRPRHPRRDLPARHPVRRRARAWRRFRTIWPGWYRGRTPHIHYKVFLDEATVLTSQLFFPDGASETVFRDAAYRARAGGAGHHQRRPTASRGAPARAPTPG